MLTGPQIVAALESLAVTHVVWIPDSTFGPWEAAMEGSPRLQLVRVCREGEAWPLAAGLQLAGKAPLIMMQSTGLFESGDALRNVLFDLQLPLFAILGIRNWRIPESTDSARRFALPVIEAWGVKHVWLDESDPVGSLADHYHRCRQAECAGWALMPEGHG